MAWWLGKRGNRKNGIAWFTTLKGVIGMLRNPEHTQSVFDIEDGLRGTEAYRLSLAHLQHQPGVGAIIASRFSSPPPDIDHLLRLPAGSLGHAFAHHIRDHGFDPDYFRKLQVRSDLDYVLLRMRQTHDLWHVVTGFDTSRIGELALKAFELAQTRRPMAAVIVAGGVLRYLLKDAAALEAVLRSISIGYRLGMASAPLLAQRWEEGWQRPLAAWRAELGVDAAAKAAELLAPGVAG